MHPALSLAVLLNKDFLYIEFGIKRKTNFRNQTNENDFHVHQTSTKRWTKGRGRNHIDT